MCICVWVFYSPILRVKETLVKRGMRFGKKMKEIIEGALKERFMFSFIK